MSGSRILEVAELDFRLAPYDWPFAVERAREIRSHWEERSKAQPKLFNGRVLLLGRHAFESCADGGLVLRGAYFETDFAAFLAWRDFGFPDASVCNGFSMAALQGSDGVFLLGEMSSHTANAGLIYFAAGTPDRQDVFGERVDLGASVTRELEEETGICCDRDDLWPGLDRRACAAARRLHEDHAALGSRSDGEGAHRGLHCARAACRARSGPYRGKGR